MKRYELAKNAGLNWQAIVLEDAQTRLKVLIKEYGLKRRSMQDFLTAAKKIIQEHIKLLQSEELKRSALNSLTSFATVQYRQFRIKANRIDFSAFLAFAAFRDKKTKASEVRAKKFVPAVYAETAQPLNEYMSTYIKRVDDMITELANAQPKTESKLSLRAAAEIIVRQERRDNEYDSILAQGVRFVWISTHGNCSERCEPYQGKLYSTDHTSGVIDGIRFRPIEVAREIYVTTKAGKTYRNGCTTGFNCRHRLLPYDGYKKPIDIPAEVVDKQRRIEKTQRKLEERVRKYRDISGTFANVDKEKQQHYKEKAEEWNEKYKAFSRANNVAFYPSRTEILWANLKNQAKYDLPAHEKALPNYEKAVINEAKILRYSLQETNKARAFNSALGINKSNYKLLTDQIFEKLPYYEAVRHADLGYGVRYSVNIDITGANGKTAQVKTAWIDDKESGTMRLISAYID